MMKRLKQLSALMFAATASCLSYGACWEEAGKLYYLDPDLLMAIGLTESGLNAQARHHNKDGSYDVGLMQINSRHFPRLAAYGITEKKLLNDPCISVMAGAWILAEFVERMGYNWNAVGAYNAGAHRSRQALRDRYVSKVAHHYRRIKLQAAATGAVRPVPVALSVTQRK